MSCKTCFGKIESLNLNYSDHEGVCAEFELKSKKRIIYFNGLILVFNRISHEKGSSTINYRSVVKNKIDPRIDYYLDSKTIILKQIDTISYSQFFFVFVAILAFVVLLVLNNVNPYFSLVKNVLLTIFIFYSFIYVVFIKMIEKKQLKMTVDAMDVIIDGYFFNLKSTSFNWD